MQSVLNIVVGGKHGARDRSLLSFHVVRKVKKGEREKKEEKSKRKLERRESIERPMGRSINR